jgi:hypothetical protein
MDQYFISFWGGGPFCNPAQNAGLPEIFSSSLFTARAFRCIIPFDVILDYTYH